MKVSLWGIKLSNEDWKIFNAVGIYDSTYVEIEPELLICKYILQLEKRIEALERKLDDN